MDGEQSICYTVVATVAEHKGVAPEAMQPPLHTAVDTDALETLFRTTDGDRAYPTVEFTYNGYRIRVDGPDAISVDNTHQSDTQTEPIYGQ
ncbi:HalOD1 output domain-containing protein [Natronolimnobius baerhuensis]|uniref:Halobacterial output domain-containing protein n=1 Tax=Natronolimnobius baerhuensis TaxID=253108 RepID=A0A202E541_9EURY|nr:HalOD1 output domain-containing protein [Natronolimnobius baerhuensis]OVE83357.1 hypothetical protein B2G88_12905 [Natronolimnobius baerhuensis]